MHGAQACETPRNLPNAAAKTKFHQNANYALTPGDEAMRLKVPLSS
jgi:hypothetical protein